jgi:hypothetical protein
MERKKREDKLNYEHVLRGQATQRETAAAEREKEGEGRKHDRQLREQQSLMDLYSAEKRREAGERNSASSRAC